jgi:hypothetical protein
MYVRKSLPDGEVIYVEGLIALYYYGAQDIYIYGGKQISQEEIDDCDIKRLSNKIEVNNKKRKEIVDNLVDELVDNNCNKKIRF